MACFSALGYCILFDSFFIVPSKTRTCESLCPWAGPIELPIDRTSLFLPFPSIGARLSQRQKQTRFPLCRRLPRDRIRSLIHPHNTIRRLRQNPQMGPNQPTTHDALIHAFIQSYQFNMEASFLSSFTAFHLNFQLRFSLYLLCLILYLLSTT